MAEQLWKGRFSKAVDSRVNDFNSSIRFDQRMIAQDMRGSGVHAAMLAKQGIISEKDCEDILNGLASIADDLAAGRLEIDPNAEDVHTFVEQTLTARIGDAGKRLHTGRSRNDQVALDIRLTLRDYSHTLQAYIVELIKVICKKAGENTTAVMPGYTHLQRAQPITFGHALMAYASMLLRDLQRFEDATARMDAQCPLGSGALAGTTYPLDRQFTAEKLGFAAPCANSLDGVSDRDFCIELANAISICMMHLSRLSEEIILWCSWEFKFIELDDAFTTGSSIMPQKKNPDVTELIRGKTGRVYGDLNTLLVMMKGIPLAYEMARQSGKYWIPARKGPKLYMREPVIIEDQSITTAGKQTLVIDKKDIEYMDGKRILIVDDVISTGGSLHALETLAAKSTGTVVGCCAALAEGDAAKRTDIFFLEPLPLFLH